MHVIKRDGSRVPFDLSKWQAQIAKVCEGVADVSPSMIEISASALFQDGMSTKELDEIALKSMVNLIDEEEHPDVGNVNYQHVAGKQRLTMLRKDVFGQYTPPRLYDIVKRNVQLDLYTHELLEWYSEADWDVLQKCIDHDKDELLPYAAIAQLVEKYLIRNRATGLMVETPQIRYMVAAATMFHAEKKDRLKYVRDFYNAASDGMFTMATPVLSGLGTKTKQFSSCVLIKTDDSLKSIFASGEVMANYASKRAGIGFDIGRMRGLGASIRKGEIQHTGILGFLKKWLHDLRSCSAGGVRTSAATINMPIWHYQFDDFIVLKNNKGTEETRVRQLDYCVVLSAFFWRRLKNKGVITFFDPNEVPDLYEAFYRDIKKFEELYVKYEKRKDIRTKVESAEKVFKDWLLTERTETGRIYLLNIDNVQNHGSFDPIIHPVYQTNLCCLVGETVLSGMVNGVNRSFTLKESVELLESGQRVLVMSKNIDTGQVEYKAITAALQTGVDRAVMKITDTETGYNITCTPDHRIFTFNRDWVRADELVFDDVLDVRSKIISQCTGVQITELQETRDVFDITVEDNHNFYANGILVHNCEIMLPTESFQRVDDIGELSFEVNGQEVTVPNTSIAKLRNGTEKLTRYITTEDDVLSFILPNGKEVIL